MANLHIVECEVLSVKNDAYRLKVSVLDLGMYIFGFRASRSDRNTGGWWVQPPATKTISGWKPNPEFDKKQPLWMEVEAACISTVNEYCRGIDTVYAPDESELNDQSISESLDTAFRKMKDDEV